MCMSYLLLFVSVNYLRKSKYHLVNDVGPITRTQLHNFDHFTITLKQQQWHSKRTLRWTYASAFGPYLLNPYLLTNVRNGTA